MSHAPAETLNLISTAAAANMAVHSAHEQFQVDGSDLNLLAILRCRLVHGAPLSEDERHHWILIMEGIERDAQKSNPTAVIR